MRELIDDQCCYRAGRGEWRVACRVVFTLVPVATVILLRHARSEANGSGTLAGRAPDIELDETGHQQAAAVAQRLADVPVAGLVRSPLLRCEQTLRPLAHTHGLEPTPDERLSEVDYGEWTGRKLSELTEEPLWRVVQARPSAAQFPGGERLSQVQARALEAVRDHDTQWSEQAGDTSIWLLCSHGDVIKSILADALGQHLDTFQRLVVDPGSISVVRYTDLRPFVLRVNDNGGDLASIIPKQPAGDAEESDAVVGGTSGAN